MKALYAARCAACTTTAPFLVTGTGWAGSHGYGERGATAPLGGAVTGFAKAYQKERPDTLVKAVDLPVERKTAALADLFIEETLRDPGCVEVGRLGRPLVGVGLVEQPFRSVTQARPRPARAERSRSAPTPSSW